jgi:hypothetical protein
MQNLWDIRIEGNLVPESDEFPSFEKDLSTTEKGYSTTHSS